MNKIFEMFRLPPSQEDRTILLICLGVAFLFWLIVKLDESYAKEMDVPLNYVLSESEAFAELPPSKGRATMKGTGWTLIQRKPNLSLTIDLTQTNQRFINSSFLETEIAQKVRYQNLTVVRMTPEFIDLDVEERMSKKVPIEVQDSISFASEHFLRDSIQIIPDSVIISGPISVVDGLERWTTQLIRKDNLEESVKDSVRLEQGKGVLEFEPFVVEVHIPVEQYTEKVFFVPVQVEHEFDSLKIFPNKVQLHVTVGLSDFNSISKDDFVLEADIKTATRTGDNNTAPLIIRERPLSARAVHFSPKYIEFFIIEEEKEEEASSKQ